MHSRKLVAHIVAGVTLCLFVGCGDEGGGPVGAPPTFAEFPGLSLTGVNYCSLAWGDCDNDGDLDLAVAGYFNDGAHNYTTKVYKNIGGTFDGTEIATGLTGVFGGSLSWGDADNDGDLDLALAGYTGIGYITTVYENVGGAFDGTEIATGLTGVTDCSLAWGDADNDGDLDLAVAGRAGIVRTTTVYENVGGAFDGTEIATGLTGVSSCSLSWGDADNDGDLDLAVAGYTGSAYTTKVYENIGGTFDGTEIATSLTGANNCSLAWGDADNDGDLDLAVAGYTGIGNITTVYENVGGAFDGTEIATGLTEVTDCSLSWGDADNDGDLDLAVAGQRGSYFTTVYENVGGAFDGTEIATGLTAVGDCSLSWGDADNDGDLDLALSGWTGSGYLTTVYENDGPLPNVPPDAPTGLAATPAAGEALLSWLPASDNETPEQGLSYNVRVVNTGTSAVIVAGMADTATGRRRVPAIGPVRPDVSTCSWTVKGLAAGDYEFQVQAIDTSFAGGAWSAAKAFTVP